MSERSLPVAPIPSQNTASEETSAFGRVDVLALIAEVEKRLGDVRAQVHGQHEDGTALARERDRLRGEIEILENERSRLLARQFALESQLAEARASEADAHAQVEHAKAESLRELERIAAEARDARTALSTELMLEFERRAGESARLLADAQRLAEATAEAQSGLVRQLSAEIEGLRAALETSGASIASLETEREALVAERDLLAEERTSLAAERTSLAGERDAAVAARDAAIGERDAMTGERDLLAAERAVRGDELAARESELAARDNQLAVLANEVAARDSQLAAISAELRALSEELARQADDFDGASDDRRALEARHDAMSAECAQLRAEVDGILRERDALAMRLSEAESAVRAAQEAAAAARADAEAAIGSAARTPAAAVPGAASIDEDEIARAAEARIQQIMAPKVAQLAQAASFLRKRKERLAAVRAGLRRKAQALRVLRQIYAQPRLDAGLVVGPVHAPSNASDAVHNSSPASPSSSTGFDGRIAEERAELARERQELVDLRAILAASERSIEQRAQGTRFITAAAVCAAMLGVAGVASWHIAGAIVPERVRATVELDVASRTPEAKQDGAVDAKPIGEELARAMSDEAFVGAVASRLVERGRSHDEASALVAGLSARTQVSTEGTVVRVGLAGEGSDATVSALDAVATSAVAELNRRPERRSDMLRVGIANARQEVGRTVFSRSEAIADPARIWRAGAILGAFAVLAAAAAWSMTWLARRAAHADVH